MNRRSSLLGGAAVIGMAVAAAGLMLRRKRAGGPAPLPMMEADPFSSAHVPLDAPVGPLRVFHLGHSLVGRDMPAMVAQMAPEGHDYASQLGWGATLRAHWMGPDEVPGFTEENDHPAYRPARAAIESGDYGAVVLTEMVELRDAIRWHGSSLYLAEWARLAHQARPDCRVYLYETWHRLDDEAGWLERIDADSDGLWRDELIRRAMGAEGVGVIYRIAGGPVLAAVARAAEAGELPGLQRREGLFARLPDGSLDQIHLSDLGNYVIALAHCAVLYHRDPRGLPADLKRADGSRAEAFDPDSAARIQAIVWEVVRRDPLSGLRP
ncbi:hypothetical protein [Paracoccus seriniphilus]|uniref:Uncharacterized protein n=1 Tax=Paracoccus seriniphilus TaxID=184748 RepID=A0A239PMJ0_9RHOB|nr:hypothetical protein [Paracoccus seriniphilus]SNT71529.1 hypothetical protein SAMN05444959_10237 [Paracoccus seriniphilus]